MRSVVRKVDDIYNSFFETSEVLSNLITKIQDQVRITNSSYSMWYDLLKPELEKNDSNPIHTKKDGMEVRMSRKDAESTLERLGKEVNNSLPYQPIILEMAFIYLISIFDAFFVDVLMILFSSRPEILKSKKQITYEKILEFNKKGELVKYLAEREINEVSYKSIKEQAEYVLQKFNIDICCSGVQIGDLIKVKLIRNILVHNKGIINSIFIESIQDSNYKEGARIQVSYDYWIETNKILGNVVSHLKNEVHKKFG